MQPSVISPFLWKRRQAPELCSFVLLLLRRSHDRPLRHAVWVNRNRRSPLWAVGFPERYGGDSAVAAMSVAAAPVASRLDPLPAHACLPSPRVCGPPQAQGLLVLPALRRPCAGQQQRRPEDADVPCVALRVPAVVLLPNKFCVFKRCQMRLQVGISMPCNAHRYSRKYYTCVFLGTS